MANSSFAKANRLLTANDFSLVFKSSRVNKLKASDRYFMMLARANEQQEARIGFAVAKSKIKLAVSRNRIKRIIREQFRLLNKTSLNIDVVVMANSACVSASNDELVKSYQLLWEKLQQQHKRLYSS